MSGIKGANSGGGNTTFLKIAGNAIWQTAGNIDVNNPLYAEEDYEFGEKTGTRKGYKIGSILGTLNSVFFKETKFGEMMNVYMDVNTGGESTERYCLGLSLDGGWDKHQVCKRMMLGLMYLDTSEEFEINVSQNKGENDFTSTTLWITQGGKNLVLNPDVDPEKVDLERQIEMPISVLELIADIRTPDRDEMKDLQPKKKIRLREDELDDLKAVMESEVIPRLNQGSENNESASAEPKEEPKEEPAEVKPNGGGLGGGTTKPAPKAKAEVADETPVKPKRETARERIERLKKEKAAKG